MEKDITQAIKVIIDAIQGEDVDWLIEGSACLKLQGIDLKVGDIDITTNNEGLNVFRKVLSEHIVQDSYREKTKGSSVICEIEGREVEINVYGDRDFDVLEYKQMVEIDDIEIPILPLVRAKEVYAKFGVDSKVEIIDKHLEER